MDLRWHPAQDDADWLAQTLEFVGEAERDALAAHGAFHIVLAGGGTPRKLYAALSRQAHDWAHWHIWFGDERCLPADHPERNSRMAQVALLARVPIPAGQTHVIPAETGAQAAAVAYARQLAYVDTFDLVLLGLGEDGHTASLFPGHDWNASDVLAVFDAPKPPPERVSLSAPRLSRSHRVLFLVAGAGKRDALARWRAGDTLPASAIQPSGGVDILLDAAAQGAMP